MFNTSKSKKAVEAYKIKVVGRKGLHRYNEITGVVISGIQAGLFDDEERVKEKIDEISKEIVEDGYEVYSVSVKELVEA